MSKKIVRVSIVDQVADALKKDIKNGVFKSGDKLPSESELAASFGVNRLSVRMALQKLNTLGITETRIGEGTYVCSFSFLPVIYEVSDFYDSKSRFHDTQQLRILLEKECSYIAAASATPEDIGLLRDALLQFNSAVERYLKDPENQELLSQLIESDWNFHFTIVKLSHNQLYIDIFHMVHHVLCDHMFQLLSFRIRQSLADDTIKIGDGDIHTDIFHDIVASDMEALKEHTRQMLDVEIYT